MRDQFEQRMREQEVQHRRELERAREQDEYTDAGSVARGAVGPVLGRVVQDHPENEFPRTKRRFRVSAEQEQTRAAIRASLSDQRQVGFLRELARRLADIARSVNDNLILLRQMDDVDARAEAQESLLEEIFIPLDAPLDDESVEGDSEPPSLIEALRVRQDVLCVAPDQRGIREQALNVQDGQTHVTSVRVRRLVESGALKALHKAQAAVVRAPGDRRGRRV